MARRGKGWAATAIAGLGVGAILGGMLIAGGPGQGRAERRDAARRDDLLALETQLACLAQESGQLTARIEATPACPAEPRQTDPETGVPYRIEQIDDENLRLCARFEVARLPAATGYGGEFDAEGCKVMNLPRSAYLPDGG